MNMFLCKIAVVLCAVSTIRGSWVGELVETGRHTLVQCQRQTRSFQFSNDETNLIESAVKMKGCVQTAFLESLDDVIESSEIPLSDDIALVSARKSIDNSTGRSEGDHNILTAVAHKIHSLLETHDVKINLSAFEEPESADRVEGRQRRIRRRFRKAFPLVVAGFIIMAAILIPPGFQFMALITSKALLIAKVAFIMAMAGHYRSLMSDLNFHHHELLHQGDVSSIQLGPGELPGGFTLPGQALVGASNGLTQALSLQGGSPFGLGSPSFALRRS